MNLEQLEHLLAQLHGEPVIVAEPRYGRVNFAFSGILTVTADANHHVGFHLITPMHEVAIIFFAEDVIRIDPPGQAPVKNIIRLRGPNDYAESWTKA